MVWSLFQWWMWWTVAGQAGQAGQNALSRVAQERKLVHAHVQILHQLTVVTNVPETTRGRAHAMPEAVMATVSFFIVIL